MTSRASGASSAPALPGYAPVPRSALGPALNDQGYYVGRVERNLYWVTDGDYHSAFLTTRDGVVLFDAPPSIGQNLQRAVNDIAAAGHLGRLGTRNDVTVHQQYIADIEAGARTALATVDPIPYFQKYGENLWAAVRGYLDAVADAAAAPVIKKYTGVLGAVDVFTVPTAFSILESIRLDLGYRMDVHPKQDARGRKQSPGSGDDLSPDWRQAWIRREGTHAAKDVPRDSREIP